MLFELWPATQWQKLACYYEDSHLVVRFRNPVFVRAALGPKYNEPGAFTKDPLLGTKWFMDKKT
jgi:hypothetical protein